MSKLNGKNCSVPDENQKISGFSGSSRGILYRESVIFILTVLFFYLFARIGFDAHHDGVMLIPAIRIASGEVLFRDVFFQYGLLVPFLQGTVVALFGGELLAVRLLTVLFYGGSAVLLDVLWRRFLPEKISYLVVLMFWFFAGCTMVTFHSWSSVYALFFMLLSGYFLLRFLEKRAWANWNLLYSGLAAGLTWSCRTPCGMVTVFAAVLVLLGANFFTGKKAGEVFRGFGIYISGTLAVGILSVLCIVLSGGWEDFIKQNFSYVTDFVYGRGSGGNWQYFSESMFPFFQQEYWFCNAFFGVMPLGAMIMLYFSCRKGIVGGAEVMEKELPFIALLILGLGSWHQYYPVPCVRHLFWGGAPMFGAYLLMICRLWHLPNRFGGRILAAFAVFVMLLSLFPRFMGMCQRLEFSQRSICRMPGLKGIRLNIAERNIIDMVCYVEQMPEPLRSRGLLNWSEDSLFSLMTPSSGFKDVMFYRFGNNQYPDYDEKILKHINEKRPVVLVDHDVFIPGYQTFAEMVYLGKRYRLLVPTSMH